MKKIINYEKDILFKTNIGEICSISLEHDFTLDGNVLVGEFIVSGEYKPNVLSLNKEQFSYQLPLEYELDDDVDLGSLSYDIDNFEYSTEDETLSVFIDFGVEFEKKADPVPIISEEELNFEDIEIPSYEDEGAVEETREDFTIEEIDDIENEKDVEAKKDRMDDADKDTILMNAMEEDEFITYHVHIVRDGDTLDSIAHDYNTSVDVIKAYNSFEVLEVKSKLIIPEEKDE